MPRKKKTRNLNPLRNTSFTAGQIYTMSFILHDGLYEHLKKTNSEADLFMKELRRIINKINSRKAEMQKYNEAIKGVQA